MNKPHKPEAVDASALPDISARPSFVGTGVIYPARGKSEVFTPEPLPDLSARPAFFGTGFCYPALARTKAEREAAIKRLFAAAEHAQPSDGTKMTRDEMHER